jgi:outer membrane protein OmpA-like peptidoglycan-associated protein
MIIKQFPVLGLFLLISLYGDTQNLVPNSGFEELLSCPLEYSRDSSGISKAKGWMSVGTQSTPDLYNSCNRDVRSTSVPVNAFGTRIPHGGIGFAGFLSSTENLEVALEEPLEEGKHYRLSMFVSSMGDSSEFPMDDLAFIPFILSKEMIYSRSLDKCCSIAGKLTRNDGKLIYDLKNWIEVATNYTAKGGERFLIFGGGICPVNSIKRPRHTNYYYVDDVCLVRTDLSAPISSPFSGTLPRSKTLELKNVNFGPGKAVLLPGADKELNQLEQALKKDTVICIEIMGFTDKEGTEAENIQLSKARAEIVRSFLVSKGIAARRLNIKGYGSSQPKGNNSTEEGRKRNRRVEVKRIDH